MAEIGKDKAAQFPATLHRADTKDCTLAAVLHDVSSLIDPNPDDPRSRKAIRHQYLPNCSRTGPGRGAIARPVGKGPGAVRGITPEPFMRRTSESPRPGAAQVGDVIG